MRRFDKLKNITNLNLLAEQRYFDTISENSGPITDIEGVADNLMGYYKDAILGKQDLEWADEKVYYMVKKTLMGHGADSETKKAMYMALANKLNSLIGMVPDASLRSSLETKAKSWVSMAQQADVKVGNTSDLFKHLGM